MSNTLSLNRQSGAAMLPTVSYYIESVASEGEKFAQVAGNGGFDIPIAACPGWTMRDLVRHLGEIHLWAAANVAFPRPRWLHVPELPDLACFWPELAADWPTDDELLAWYVATHANLVDVLQSAPLDVEAFSFLPAPTPLIMWARRQASEIAVHRFDAEQARGMRSSFGPAFAADMLDELLSGFAPQYLGDGAGVTRVLRIVATDVDEQWWVTMMPTRTSTSRCSSEADLTIAATAANLYLTLWNRMSGEPLAADGNEAVLEEWRNRCRVVWNR